MIRMIVMMLLDLICWSGFTFFAFAAGYTTVAAIVGAVGIVVILRELITIYRVWWMKKYQEEMNEHKDYDDRQDSDHTVDM